MGTSTSVAQLAGKLDRLAADLRDVRVPLERTALQGKRIFEASAAAAGVLGSRVAGKRKTIGARYDFVKASNGNATVVIFYTGPAHLVANPTRPHRITPRRPRGSRSRRRSGAQALTINGNLRASADHPGTRGKDFFSRARAIAERTLPKVYAQAQLTEPIRRIF